jgi:hypothetical protein
MTRRFKLLLPLLLLVLIALFATLFRSSEKPAIAKTPEPSTKSVARAVISEFREWNELHRSKDLAPAELAKGVELARARRKVMEELIHKDPQRALEQAVTLDVWKNLPPEVRAEVEEPFSAIANYQVLPVCIMGSPDAERVIASGVKLPDATRYTEIAGEPALETQVFGRRQALSSKVDAPVQGIRLGHRAALREKVFHELAASEIKVAESIYPLANPAADRDFATGLPLGDQPVTALAGGKIFKFADHEGLDKFDKSIAALDETLSPQSGAGVLFLPSAADGSSSSGEFDLEQATATSNSLASTWTETKKKVFMIRCDFSDKTNATNPVVDAGTYSTLLNTTVSSNILDSSYGKTWIEATVSNTITRLPQPTTYYDDDVLANGNTRNSQLLTDAKAAYQTANPGFVPGNYDIIGVWFVSIGMKGNNVTYAGLAGGGDLWIQGTSDAGVHVHEFGHNYGLGHSSLWIPPSNPPNTNPVDPAGSSVEYGDDFDVMGGGPVPEGVFHSEAKVRLNWLAAGQWTDITTSGTHRLFRIDHPSTTGVRGLRVPKGADEYYSLSYRRQFANSWLKAGANIVWKRPSQGRSWLIDTTPDSIPGDSTDLNDGSIAIGRTYSDGNSHITPLARGGTSPNEYLDIRVNIGTFAGNAAPTVTLNGPSTLAARQSCIFTAQAADANGDTLAYSWDFGQGFTFDNNASATYAWNSGGTYTVKVTVSDMKGMTVTGTKTVTVVDPVTTWTARATNFIGDFNALAASPIKVIAAGDSDQGQGDNYKGPVATSADGITWTSTQLGNNQHAYGAVWDGTQFLLAGMDYDFSLAVPAFVGCVFTSPTANAGTWTRRIFAGSPLNGIAHNGIVGGGSICVAVGKNGTIRRSTDGITWPLVTSGTTNNLASVAYGGGKFVAVGYAGGNGSCSVLISTDGNTWTDTSTGAGVASWQDLRHIAWANDRFLASGWFSKLRHSTDLGVSFNTNRTLDDKMPGVAYGNGVWFAAGVDNPGQGSEVDLDLISTDGANWTPLFTPSIDNRNAAIFFNNTFITAGQNHTIRQSGTIAPAAIGYYAWRENLFPNHDPLTGPESDYDTDGVSNLMEYALSRVPSNGGGLNGVQAHPQAVIVSSEPLLSDRIALQVSMPEPAANDLTYIVETSTTLTGTWTTLATKVTTGAWTWNGGGTSRIISAAPSGGRVLVKIGDSVPMAGNPRRFLRLRTTVNQ